jgi:hypothetical protein
LALSSSGVSRLVLYRRVSNALEQLIDESVRDSPHNLSFLRLILQFQTSKERLAKNPGDPVPNMGTSHTDGRETVPRSDLIGQEPAAVPSLRSEVKRFQDLTQRCRSRVHREGRCKATFLNDMADIASGHCPFPQQTPSEGCLSRLRQSHNRSPRWQQSCGQGRISWR